MNRLQRAQGCLIGLAVGDALGAPVEFLQPGEFEQVTEMQAGGAFNLPAGYWTDDTSMALCLADSLLRCNGTDQADQLKTYVDWFINGYLSSTGYCFDIGGTTRAALYEFRGTGRLVGRNDFSLNGNGSLMRLAPIPIFYGLECSDFARLSSETTHAADASIWACRDYSLMIARALEGDSKAKILECHHHPVRNAAIASVVVRKNYREPTPPIKGSGFVVESLRAALWAFDSTASYEEAVLAAVNLGDDADTTAAITGMLAGAYYGVDAIPTRWKQQLHRYDLISDYATRLNDAKE